MSDFLDRLSVFFDARIFDHNTGAGFFEAAPSPYLAVQEQHPENADRVRNMHSVLERGPIAEALDWFGAEPATRDDLLRFHTNDYIRSLEAIPANQTHWFSSTTLFGPGSFDVCRVSSGLALAAARQVWSGKAARAYALCRPPGHHAQPAAADGYCFINNIGVAIEALRSEGLQRACVIDWDVHHGNGTQEGFYEDPNVLTVSLHMDHRSWGPDHPQTGMANEVGRGNGIGSNLNVPLPYGSGNVAYLRAFDEIIAPAVRSHAPDILFIACGQDANQFDPNGRQIVDMEGFYQLGRRARALADELCDGKLVLVQEGGYAVSYAAYCLHATLEGVLSRERALSDPVAYMPDHGEGLDAVLAGLTTKRNAALKA